jgi:hypothetical protein
MIKNAVAALMRGYICGCVSSQTIALAADLHRELSEEIRCSCEVGQLKEILWKLYVFTALDLVESKRRTKGGRQ